VARNRVLFAVKDFVARHVTAGDRVLLASFDGSIRIRQAPTRDPKALVAAVDEITRSAPRGVHASQELRNLLQDLDRSPQSSGSRNSGADLAQSDAAAAGVESYVRQRYEEDRASLAALDSFISSLAGLPGRKAVLFVSGGMALRPGDVALHALAERLGPSALTSPRGARRGRDPAPPRPHRRPRQRQPGDPLRHRRSRGLRLDRHPGRRRRGARQPAVHRHGQPERGDGPRLALHRRLLRRRPERPQGDPRPAARRPRELLFARLQPRPRRRRQGPQARRAPEGARRPDRADARALPATATTPGA